MDRGRLEAFSDGVFAVAITLLVLNLAVAGPGTLHHRNPPLLQQLGHLWPAFAAYVLSFFMIGIIWVNHHALIRSLKTVDRTLLFLNVVLLLFVVLIPFTTGLVAEYLSAYLHRTPGGGDAGVAMALYGAVFFGMSVGFGAIFEWTLHGDRVFQPVPRELHWPARIRFVGGGGVYLVAIAVAPVGPIASFVIMGLLAVYYIFERTPTMSQTPGDPGAADSPGDDSPLI